MASDTSLVFNLVARDRVSGQLSGVAGRLDRLGTAATRMAKGLTAGLAPASALAAGVGAVASSFAAAGVAAGAFKLAASQQMEQVTDAAELWTKAQEAAAQGGEQAAEAQKAYNDALAQMTPATRETATAFVGLKSDFSQWSDSLSSTTMPVFTKGIGILRDLLPQLTPLVKAAAGAFSNFLDGLAGDLQSAGFKDWIADMSAAAGPALENLLATIKNVATGVGGLMQALLPANQATGDLTSSMVAGSEAFAEWATGLKGSEGLAQFSEMAQTGGAALGNLALALGKVLVALSPLLGVTTMLAGQFARLVAAIPTPVLTTLAAIIGSITLAMKIWSAVQTILAFKTTLLAAKTWLLNSALLANPITWIILLVIALIAIVVLLVVKWDWVKAKLLAAWAFVKKGLKAGWDWMVRNVFAPIGRFFTQTIPRWVGQGVQWIVGKWEALVAFVTGLPGKIARAARGMWDGITASFRSAVNWLIGKWNGLSLTIGGGSVLGLDIPSVTLNTPNIPYLAEGGNILRGGSAVVGEAGPELISMPRGAQVTPLTGGAGGGAVRVIFDVQGADEDMKRMIRRMVRVDGHGDVQVAFGR